MRIEELNDYLREHMIHIFSIYDVSKLISKSGPYSSKFISRDKYVKRAVRGLYYTADATEYEIASKILFPSYISLVSSLRFHNLTEQMPNTIFVMSTVQHRTINDLNGFKIKFKVMKESMFYGYGKVDDVFVADPEKAVIDMLYLNEFIEYAEEAVQKQKLDTSKLIEYAERSRTKTIIKKVESMLNVK